MSISLYYSATVFILGNYVIYCSLRCRSFVDLVGHVQVHMIIETNSEMSFEG